MFIAEIGINHNGDLSTAKKMIDVAKRAGADFVKFQKRDLDLCITDTVGRKKKQTPWGEMTYREYKEIIEFEKQAFDEIHAYCKTLDIGWFASVWDINSLNFLMAYEPPYIKVPSACITDLSLLKAISKTNIPIIISTGMSSETEIAKAVEILDENELYILHCNSSYPSNEDELNLLTIQTLKNRYPKHVIGYSGHEEGILPTVIAKSLGAKLIERHITLDRNMWGTDQRASLDEVQLTELIDELKKLDRWLGDGEIRVYESEKVVRDKLRVKQTKDISIGSGDDYE